ncbi:hypothetical protein AB1Y20_020563 [Prymnesium parvum]|uniref:Uncharacterized protein n=1 Tax=Prymnesium parvum TaxID=97485 RepID=A0AB34JU10_PRYPA
MALAWSLLACAVKPHEAPPPPPEPLELVRDTFLFQGEYGWYFYWFALIGFTLANGKSILGEKTEINFFHGLALQVMTAYGGSSICAVICGRPVAFFVNESLAPVSICTYCALYYARSPLTSFMNSVLGSIIISIAYETMRVHVLMNCAGLAANTLTSFISGAYPVPVAGPLVGGILGGCGGAFLPADKGLKPLENGTNWRIASAVLMSIWIQMSLRDPYSKELITQLAPVLAQQKWCQFCAIAFAVLCGTASVITGFAPLGPNPLIIKRAPQEKAKKA